MIWLWFKGLVLTNIIGNVVSRDQMDLGITFIENMGLDFFRDHSYSNSTHTFVLADYYYFYFLKKLINIWNRIVLFYSGMRAYVCPRRFFFHEVLNAELEKQIRHKIFYIFENKFWASQLLYSKQMCCEAILIK